MHPATRRRSPPASALPSPRCCLIPSKGRDRIMARAPRSPSAEPAGTSFPAWRTARRIIGHEQAIGTLHAAAASGRMPHAWLFAGPQGVGKASLACAWARSLLARQATAMGAQEGKGTADFSLAAEHDSGPGLFDDEKVTPPSRSEGGQEDEDFFALSADHPVFRQVAAGSHPDLLILDPEEMSAGEGGRARATRQIRVEDVRRIHRFYAHTASSEGWRITLIDEAEAMNLSAANALLKILEEPPARGLLILVSHQPGRLLPTIRSRCRTLVFQPLTLSDMHDFLAEEAPECDAPTRDAAARLAEGAPGRALNLLRNDGLTLYRELLGLLADENVASGLQARARFIEQVAGDPERHRLVLDLWRDLHARLVRFAVSPPAGKEEGPLPEEAVLLERWCCRSSPDEWIERWERTGRLIEQAERLYLDRKQVLWTLFAEDGLPGVEPHRS
ncbi:MAG: AAA family ATPase [Alphaproteobacteria bacterium]|nr:MAG: AAA family ATPase [Alphaproteobacteria bacterium]